MSESHDKRRTTSILLGDRNLVAQRLADLKGKAKAHGKPLDLLHTLHKIAMRRIGSLDPTHHTVDPSKKIVRRFRLKRSQSST